MVRLLKRVVVRIEEVDGECGGSGQEVGSGAEDDALVRVCKAAMKTAREGDLLAQRPPREIPVAYDGFKDPRSPEVTAYIAVARCLQSTHNVVSSTSSVSPTCPLQLSKLGVIHTMLHLHDEKSQEAELCSRG